MVNYDLKAGTTGLRKEVIDSMVKQIAARAYKFKQAVAIVPTSAWKNTFYREQTDVPAGQSGNATKGLSRGANFPQYALAWEEVSVRIVKHGLEDNIPWEDILSNDINVQARTIIRLTEGVVKSVDDDIWDSLTESRTGTGRISSFAVASSRYWNGASAAIINDLMKASRLIGEANYDTSDLMCFINPRMKQGIMSYLVDKGAQFPSIATGVANNGRIGRLAGVQLIESNSCTASYALVVKPKTCGTWKSLVSLRSNVTDDPYRSVRIRIVEEGVVELTDPLAVVLIKGIEHTTDDYA